VPTSTEGGVPCARTYVTLVTPGASSTMIWWTIDGPSASFDLVGPPAGAGAVFRDRRLHIIVGDVFLHLTNHVVEGKTGVGQVRELFAVALLPRFPARAAGPTSASVRWCVPSPRAR